MSMVINTNTAATAAALNVSRSNSMLQKSLARLSSGSRITSPADDAGGLAVSMKLEATVRRTDATNTNVQNAISFLQSQDGALKVGAGILTRMSELRTLYEDNTKSSSDKANYNSEFTALKSQLTTIQAETFNGVSLFGTTGSTLSVTVNESGSTISVNKSDLAGQLTDLSAGITGSTQAELKAAIAGIATLRASNGASVSRLQSASEMLNINKINIESANSRIKDTDVAEESTQFARHQVLVQSGVAMLSQANTVSQYALRLLG